VPPRLTFALAHGAWHGGWCWERLHAPLRERGHESVAVDLPSDDPEAGLDAQARAIADALSDVDDEVVIVAHSASGLVAPLVPALRPVRSIVYLAAFLPVPGQSMADQFKASSEPIILFEGGGREIDELGRSFWAEADAAARQLHPDLSTSDAERAFARLRPQAQLSQMEPHPAGLPEVAVASIVCANDRVVNPDWARRVTRERLGIEPIELSTGHFPMVTHPERLADALAAAAA
jgi:pimeloyl-ACP methyl ester carboxylesterase